MGMGMDAHRTYEALALGLIPIVRRSPLSGIFEHMSVAVVDAWEDVTAEALNTWSQRWPNGPTASNASLDSWVCNIDQQINQVRARLAREKDEHH